MTPTEPSFEERVLRGFAADLAANPAATVALAYDDETDPAYIYAPEAVGLVLDRYPQGPDGAVTLTDYTVTDDLSLSDSVIGIQLTIRHPDRAAVKAIAADVFNLFHGRGRGMLGSVTLVSARRTSGTNTGQDSNERQGRIENYYLTVHRPSANRL
jgi:hypothetical protein